MLLDASIQFVKVDNIYLFANGSDINHKFCKKLKIFTYLFDISVFVFAFAAVEVDVSYTLFADKAHHSCDGKHP